MRVLVVTAVDAERAVIASGAYESAVVGVGAAAAAAGTARLLTLAEVAGAPYDLVVSAGVGGAFPGRAEIGDVVVGTASVAADLGAESPTGFISMDELGFGIGSLPAKPVRLGVPAISGVILTVSTVTGTSLTTAELATRHPDAVAEAMEGFGVAVAAAQAGVAFAEVRAISNLIGPRDRGAWRLEEALAGLAKAITTMAV